MASSARLSEKTDCYLPVRRAPPWAVGNTIEQSHTWSVYDTFRGMATALAISAGKDKAYSSAFELGNPDLPEREAPAQQNAYSP